MGILRVEFLVGIFRRLFSIIIIIALLRNIFLLLELLHVMGYRYVQFRLDLLIAEEVVNVLFRHMILNVGLVVVLDAYILSVGALKIVQELVRSSAPISHGLVREVDAV